MLYANTDDGSSAIWVLDSDGVVIDNISYSIADRAQILAQINEHYGTSFTGWSDNEIGLRIGDTIPNWNAYEKIELPEEPQYFRIYLQDYAGNMVGWLIGNIITLCMLENTMNIVIAAGGKMTNAIEGSNVYFNIVKNSVSNYYGISIEDLQIVNSEDSYSVGDNIPYYGQCVRI